MVAIHSKAEKIGGSNNCNILINEGESQNLLEERFRGLENARPENMVENYVNT